MTTNYQQDLEQPACPMCGSRRALPRYKFKPYSVVRCEDCRFHFLSPRLTERSMLQTYESEEYFGTGAFGYDTDYSEQEHALRLTYRRLLRQLHRRSLTGGRLLEVGCGYGYLLDEARSFYSVVAGTEYSPMASEFASAHGSAVYRGGVEAVPIGRPFDTIIASHVIEHIYSPSDFLQQLKNHLAPGGAVILAAPNMSSVLRYLMGSKWPSFKIPEHIHYFDKASLEALMRRSGLKHVETLPFTHAFPIPLIARKLGLQPPPSLRELSLFVPTTTVAAIGFAET